MTNSAREWIRGGFQEEGVFEQIPVRPLEPSTLKKKKKKRVWSSHRGSAETKPARNHEAAGLIPALDQWVKDPVLP